jgi:hypothetical protein
MAALPCLATHHLHVSSCVLLSTTSHHSAVSMLIMGVQGQTGANGRQGSGGLSLENKRLLHSVVPEGTPGRGSAVR